jgi:hypothetical protein
MNLLMMTSKTMVLFLMKVSVPREPWESGEASVVSFLVVNQDSGPKVVDSGLFIAIEYRT